MSEFVTSDTHFYHSNIIKYCNRSFNNVEEMNECIIKNWNNVVFPDDTVYHLGDFILNQKDKADEILNRLNGKIHLILGNHDNATQLSHLIGDKLVEVTYEKVIKYNKCTIILNHFPLSTFAGQGKDFVVNLHGHVHSNKENPFVEFTNQYDVGVDNNDFTPISIEQAIKKATQNKLDSSCMYNKSDILEYLIKIGVYPSDSDVRNSNIGESNYSEKVIQPWSIWQDWQLNPWDADIVKRIARTKVINNKTPEESRIEDYQKIIHICQERIRQLS